MCHSIVVAVQQSERIPNCCICCALNAVTHIQMFCNLYVNATKQKKNRNCHLNDAEAKKKKKEEP